MHFASRDAMDIDGCGEGVLKTLIAAGLVKSVKNLPQAATHRAGAAGAYGKKIS